MTALFAYAPIRSALPSIKPAKRGHAGCMKIVYAPETAPLAHDLRGMGFELHAMGEDVAADAVLFAANARDALHVRPGSAGALLLNVRGLSAAETAEALRRRIRGSIF